MKRAWYSLDRGQGRPLVLLHGIGMTHAAWAPLMDRLAESRRVIAFDVAGFGLSPQLPGGVEPTLENLATALSEELDTLGLREPVDVAGNSMGGGIALALAQLGRARSVAALSPAGLWADHSPWHTRPFLAGLQFVLRHASPLVDRLLGVAPLRAMLFAVPISPRGDLVPAPVARQQIRDFLNSRSFQQTLKAIGPLANPLSINVPVSVAFGQRDWLLTRSAQREDRLPAHSRWSHPATWGHVPMWDDPEGVAHWILEATR